MKDVIKEKLLREIEDNLISENRTYDERDIKKAIEVTSMVEYEEFNHFIDNFDFDPYLNEQEKVEIRALMKEEIKQRIKENEE